MSELGANLSPFQDGLKPIIQDFVHFSNRSIRVLAILSTLLTLIIFVVGASQPLLPLRFIVIGFGPISAFIAFTSISYLRSQETLSKDPLFFQIIAFTWVFGIASALIALTLNSSISIVVYILTALSVKIDPQTILLIFLAVATPVVEETAKAIPIFILSRSLRKEWGNSETRVFNSSGMVLFVAVLVGATFTLLETYLYIFNIIDFTKLDDPKLYNSSFFQLFIRFSFPLHIGTTVLMSLGMVLVLGNSLHRTPLLHENTQFLVAFIGSIIFHGLWNGSLVIAVYNDVPTIKLFDQVFPLFNFGLGISIIVFLVSSFILIPNIQLIPCKVCGNSHFPPFDQKAHYDILIAPSSLFSYEIKFTKPSLRAIFREIKKGTFFHQQRVGQQILAYVRQNDFDSALSEVLPECIQCKTPVGKDGICTNCRSIPMFLCETCYYPVPVYAQECWKCNRNVMSPFGRTMKLPTKLTDNISIGLGTFSAVHFITLTFMLVGLFFALGFYDSFFLYLFLYSALSTCFVLALVWVNGTSNHGAGVAFFRVVFALSIIDMTFTSLAMTLLGILFPIRFGSSTLAIMFWLFSATFLSIFAGKVLTGTRILIQQRSEDK